MATTRERLAEFEHAMGGEVREDPTPLSREELELRVNLLLEETVELICALAGRDDLTTPVRDELARLVLGVRWAARPEDADLENVAKELADVEYVLHGTAHYCGVDLDRAVEIVHESNMAKASGPRRADGKRLKPEGWTPPDMTPALGQAFREPVCETVPERTRERYREGRSVRR